MRDARPWSTPGYMGAHISHSANMLTKVRCGAAAPCCADCGTLVVWRLSPVSGPRLTALCLLLVGGCGRFGFDLSSPFVPAPMDDGGVSAPLDGGPRDTTSPSNDASLGADVPQQGDGGTVLVDSGLFDASAGDASPGDAGLHEPRIRIGTLPYEDSDDIWNRVIAGAPAVAMTVLNPNSGPGAYFDTKFQERTIAAQTLGITVVGYVTTSYAERTESEVLDEVDLYVTRYGVDGFYLDEVPNACADQPYYQSLFDTIKERYPTATVVLDPGTSVPECYIRAADILVTFQDTAAAYETFTPAAWVRNYAPERFWHLVYGATDIDTMNHVFDLAERRHVGFMYVTPDGLPNPWDTLPPDLYWLAELARANP